MFCRSHGCVEGQNELVTKLPQGSSTWTCLEQQIFASKRENYPRHQYPPSRSLESTSTSSCLSSSRTTASCPLGRRLGTKPAVYPAFSKYSKLLLLRTVCFLLGRTMTLVKRYNTPHSYYQIRYGISRRTSPLFTLFT